MALPTLVEVLETVRSRGYEADFGVTPDAMLRCGPCGHTVSPAEAVVEGTYRFEGPSNPDDQAILFALRCGGCGQKGTLVTAYGPTASAEEAAVLVALPMPPHDAHSDAD